MGQTKSHSPWRGAPERSGWDGRLSAISSGDVLSIVTDDHRLTGNDHEWEKIPLPQANTRVSPIVVLEGIFLSIQELRGAMRYVSGCCVQQKRPGVLLSACQDCALNHRLHGPYSSARPLIGFPDNPQAVREGLRTISGVLVPVGGVRKNLSQFQRRNG